MKISDSIALDRLPFSGAVSDLRCFLVYVLVLQDIGIVEFVIG